MCSLKLQKLLILVQGWCMTNQRYIAKEVSTITGAMFKVADTLMGESEWDKLYYFKDEAESACNRLNARDVNDD